MLQKDNRIRQIEFIPEKLYRISLFSFIPVIFINFEAFDSYLEYGGLPTVVELKDLPETIAPFFIGNTISGKKICDYLTSSRRKTTSDTIDNYLKMLENIVFFELLRRGFSLLSARLEH